MKGLSGAVTALILVIASVVIALIVVGFAFGLFGTFSGQGAVTNLGPAYITYTPPSSGTTGTATIQVVLNNPSTTAVQIVGVSIQSVPVSISGVTDNGNAENQPYTLSVGTNSLTITVGIPTNQITLQSGQQVTVQITLANNQVVTVPGVVNVQ